MVYYAPNEIIANHFEVASRPLIGGMGIVYLCIDKRRDQPVALKTFQPQFLPDQATRNRFLKEGITWVQLGYHPNIVQCFGIERGANGLEVYLVLELIAKPENRKDTSLRAWLSPGQPLPPELTLAFALQIARGMQHACTLVPGLIHCDLKPENLLIGADLLPNTAIPRLRVTDFGLSHVLEQSSQTSLTDKNFQSSLSKTHLENGIAGTPAYMAPEQWQGTGICLQTDMFAFGTILFEMISGIRAIPGKTVEELHFNCLGGRFSPLPANLPDPLRDLIIYCLALDQRSRPSCWNEIVRILTEALVLLTGHSLQESDNKKPLERAERVRLGWAYNCIGASYLDLGQSADAIRYLERAKGTGELENEFSLVAAGLNNLGTVYQRIGDYQKAIDRFEQSLLISRQVGDKWAEGDSLGNLGNVYDSLGNYPQAILFHKKSLTLARMIGDKQGEGKILCSIGNTYLNLGDYPSAIQSYEQYLVIARQTGDLHSQGAALGSIGLVFNAIGDYSRAINYCEQHLVITRQTSDKQGEGNALSNIGNAFRSMGDYSRSIMYYEQHLAIARQIGDQRGEGNALCSLGIAYSNIGDFSRAMLYYEQSLTIFRKIGNRHGEGIVLGNLGGIYRRIGIFHEAIHYYEEYLTIAQDIGDKQGEGNALGNIGNAYRGLNDCSQAIKYLEKSLLIFHNLGDRHGIANGWFNLAIAYRQSGDRDHALIFTQQAVELYEQINSPNTSQAREFLIRLQNE